MRIITALAVTLALVATSCGGDQGLATESTSPETATTQTASTSSEQPADASEGSSSGLTVEIEVERDGPAGKVQAEPENGEVKLWISNQSFVDDPVRISVTVDDRVVVEDDFATKDQHNSVGYRVRGLEPGVHEISATSSTNVQYSGVFTLGADSPVWLVLDYWHDDQDSAGPEFIFVESPRSVGFD